MTLLPLPSAMKPAAIDEWCATMKAAAITMNTFSITHE
jgi:hypothetical protein